jgi:hypothetical protein
MPEDDYDADLATPDSVEEEQAPDDAVCGYPVDRTAEDWPGEAVS